MTVATRSMESKWAKPHFRLFLLQGWSMRPWLLAGDALVVNCDAPRDKLQVGQIWLVEKNGLEVAHRLIAIEKSRDDHCLRFKGDRNLWPDAWITREHLLGQVVGYVRNRQYKVLQHSPWHLLLSRSRCNVLLSVLLRWLKSQ